MADRPFCLREYHLVAVIGASLIALIVVTSTHFGGGRKRPSIVSSSQVAVNKNSRSPQDTGDGQGTPATTGNLTISDGSGSESSQVDMPADAVSSRDLWNLEQFPLRNQSVNAANDDDAHIVMIGDSITRYQYLDLVYRLHFCSGAKGGSVRKNTSAGTCRPPDSLVFVDNWRHLKVKNGKKTRTVPPDFMNFFASSTKLFNGSMTCDCSRAREKFPQVVHSMIENRSYRHPTRKLYVSYLQLVGSHTMMARAALDSRSEITGLPNNAVVSLVNRMTDKFFYHGISLLTFATEFAPRISPKPTHFVINSGNWYSGDLAPTIPQVIRALHRISGLVVFRATAQSSLSSDDLFSEDLRRQWQSMTHKRQILDATVVNKGICALSDEDAQKWNRPAATFVPAAPAINKSTMTPSVCHYLSLPTIPGSVVMNNATYMPIWMFADLIHPIPFVYEYWNTKLWSFLLSLSSPTSAQ
jgi:hypothetical protein